MASPDRWHLYRVVSDQIAGVDDLDGAGEPVVIEVFGQRDHSRGQARCNTNAPCPPILGRIFPAKRPAIWSSLASPALIRRPHAHPDEDPISSDRDGTQMDNPLRPAWASDVGSTTAFLLERPAGLAL